MSLSTITFHPAPGPERAEIRCKSADRERATLAFQATYAAAVARRRRQGATIAPETAPVNAGGRMEKQTSSATWWLPDPEPDHERND